jgi:hypothetical protein
MKNIKQLQNSIKILILVADSIKTAAIELAMT